MADNIGLTQRPPAPAVDRKTVWQAAKRTGNQPSARLFSRTGSRDSAPITGRLGLEDGGTSTLIAAIATVEGALKEAGIPSVPDACGAGPGMRLRCAGFDVSLRLRRPSLKPSRQLRADLLQPTALLDLSVELEDGAAGTTLAAREDAQTVLAGLLQKLVPVMEATSVEWLDTGILLTSEQFLNACRPAFGPDLQRGQTGPAKPVHGGPVRVQPRPASAAIADRTVKPAAAGRNPPPPLAPPEQMRGRACFVPVELAAQRLDAQCEEVLRQIAYPGDSGTAASGQPGSATGPGTLAGLLDKLPGMRRLLGERAQRRAKLQTGQMRFAGQVLLLAVLMVFVENTGVVQAARPLLP